MAGGPLDKSWLMLRALMIRKHGFDPDKDTTKTFAAPPLLNEQVRNGGVDAVLNYWHFAARLKAAGLREVATVEQIARRAWDRDRRADHRLCLQRSLGRQELPSRTGLPARLTGRQGDHEQERRGMATSGSADARRRTTPPWRRCATAIATAFRPHGAWRSVTMPPRYTTSWPNSAGGNWSGIHPIWPPGLSGPDRPTDGVFKDGPPAGPYSVASGPDHHLGSRGPVAASRLLPGPGAVALRLVREVTEGGLLFHLGVTLARVAASFAIAMAIGTVLGIAMGRMPLLDRFLDGWLVLFLNVPALVTIILAYVWFGLTESAAIAAVAVNKIPNVVVTLREGARTLDRDYLEMAEAYRLGPMKTLRHIVLPQLYPYLLATARSGLGADLENRAGGRTAGTQ